MSRKDYEAIAAALKDEALSLSHVDGASTCVPAIAARLATVFADDNPRFDRARFLAACGIEGE